MPLLNSPVQTDSPDQASRRIQFPWRWILPLGLILAGLGLQQAAHLQPEMVEALYSRRAYFYISRVVSQMSRPFSFSVAEVLILLLPLAGFVMIVRQTYRDLKRRVRHRDLLASRTRALLWFAGVTFTLFLLLFGLNYHRLPLTRGLQLTERTPVAGELESIAIWIIGEINRNYDAARGAEGSAPSRLKLPREGLFSAIETAFQSEPLLAGASRGGFAAPKPVYLSRLLSRFGVAGIYVPFTGEPHFNREQPDCEAPFSIAHEKAHQRGYAREDEASFVAFLVCTRAQDPYVRYSGFLSGLRVLAPLQSAVSTERYREITSALSSGPREDLKASAEFWRRARSPRLGRIADRANNTYLKANSVKSGVRNYGEMVSLIISYYLTYPANQDPQQDRPQSNPL